LRGVEGRGARMALVEGVERDEEERVGNELMVI
jgi:hypothetical protein